MSNCVSVVEAVTFSVVVALVIPLTTEVIVEEQFVLTASAFN